jgi:hypothetical protein
MRLAKQAGVVVGLVSGVAGLLFLFFPGLRPGTGGGSAADQLPMISAVTATPGVTQGAFLASHDRKPTGFTKAQLAVVGSSISAQIQIFGYRGKHLPLEYQVLDAKTQQPVATGRPFLMTPDVDRVSRPWWEWVPRPARRGSYYVEVKLFDEHGVAALACGTSNSFGGTGGFTNVAAPKSC